MCVRVYGRVLYAAKLCKSYLNQIGWKRSKVKSIFMFMCTHTHTQIGSQQRESGVSICRMIEAVNLLEHCMHLSTVDTPHHIHTRTHTTVNKSGFHRTQLITEKWKIEKKSKYISLTPAQTNAKLLFHHTKPGHIWHHNNSFYSNNGEWDSSTSEACGMWTGDTM